MRATFDLGADLVGELIYREPEYSFDYISGPQIDPLEGGSGLSSVAVGTLQVEVVVRSGRAISVWGYWPWHGWRAMRLPIPSIEPGRVYLAGNFVEGIAVGDAELDTWRTAYDANTGWLRVSADPGVSMERTVGIANGVAMGLCSDHLNSIWLRPRFVR